MRQFSVRVAESSIDSVKLGLHGLMFTEGIFKIKNDFKVTNIEELSSLVMGITTFHDEINDKNNSYHRNHCSQGKKK